MDLHPSILAALEPWPLYRLWLQNKEGYWYATTQLLNEGLPPLNTGCSVCLLTKEEAIVWAASHIGDCAVVVEISEPGVSW